MSGPRVFDDPGALRAALDRERAEGRPIGFVPTMGALHRGHLELVQDARRRSGYVVVSIFVNPTQFGPNEDFARYPRNVQADLALCGSAGVDAAFVPSVEVMYPAGEETRVVVGRIANVLCGPMRPGHFDGVATVVAKLFAAVGPAIAVFGRKDYQQLRVIERLVRDLLFPIEIVGHPIVRDGDGLAMSSRNAYLTADERSRALSLPRALAAADQAFRNGERRVGALTAIALREVECGATSIDYVSMNHSNDLQPLDPRAELEPAGGPLGGGGRGRALLAIAARVGQTRLIDNIVLGEDSPPRVGEGTRT